MPEGPTGEGEITMATVTGVPDLSVAAVDARLRALGNYRVRRVQTVALEGLPDSISGSLLLAIGLRETGLRNIEGGAKRVDGRWVALDPNNPDDAAKMDVGWIQINRGYHRAALSGMAGYKTGTWSPAVAGKTPADPGHVPGFTEALRFALDMLHDAQAVAEDNGVPVDDRVRFAVAAHNAGTGGALQGYKAGDVDANTAMGDYSSWVLRHRTLVNRWLQEPAHEKWRVVAP